MEYRRCDFEELLEWIRGKSILVANRGIPARRICRSIRECLKGHAVVTAADIDRSSPGISAAHELLLLGGGPMAYLDIKRIVSLAKERDIAGIHPGWGFASEDPEFSRLCKEAGIVFIGPDPESMELLGSKVRARELANRLGIPTVPGSQEAVTLEEARELVGRIGCPVLLKAEGGGGGRGIYLIRDPKELDSAFEKAQVMALSSFGNANLYVEKFLEEVHHIEMQVIADRYGNIAVFDERDCSLQRDHQKLLEITPSPWKGFSPELRARLKGYARGIVRAADYHTLATVEFLVTGEGEPYLIEVNTRLQVEHGITESRYGIDLVEQQIAVAFGAELAWKEQDLIPRYWSLQCRLNLEDPRNGFSPNSGLIRRYISPGGPGVRIDSNLSSSYHFPSSFDSAGALLICYADSWKKLCGLTGRALEEYQISGLKTTLPFYRKVLSSEAFREGGCTTHFIDDHPELLDYHDVESESLRLGRLIAEISTHGHNRYVKLGEYRAADSPRLPRAEALELPPYEPDPAPHYPRRDREALLCVLRESDRIHFTDTTCRDITQSNSGNRMRLAEDRIVGPYLDRCGFFSLETGGGAHFHMNLRANMTSPIAEAAEWRSFAPRTLQQVLVRSTNLLGYKPQPRSVMERMGGWLCEAYDVIRCFDFLNCAENMRPLAEIALRRPDVVFEPSISLSVGRAYDADHYLGVAESIVAMAAEAGGWSREEAVRHLILGLKDMAGVCSPDFIGLLVRKLRERWPGLILHYHRHATDGRFLPAVLAAVEAGVRIVDTGMGAAARWYGQGDVASVLAGLEQRGFQSSLEDSALRDCNFVLKQIMPCLDRYCAPYFQGYDYDVVRHGMPGGAISSSQEGALQQGYIFLLPQILEYLAAVRQLVLYHDVTPGAQITWNNAFLSLTSAYKRGGQPEVGRILSLLRRSLAADLGELELSPREEKDRLILFSEANDAFKSLLRGEFGPLPLGPPARWVYHSTFGITEGEKIYSRCRNGGNLPEVKELSLPAERQNLEGQLGRKVSEKEFLLYLNHPADTAAMLRFQERFGNPNCLPQAVWFEGLEKGESLSFCDSAGKLHHYCLIDIGEPNEEGVSLVSFQLDYELIHYEVPVLEARNQLETGRRTADPADPMQIGAPCNGDLWIVHVARGDRVKAGQELFNISIMKQEKSVCAPCDAMVKEVHLSADFQRTNQMVGVSEGDLILELEEIGEGASVQSCPNPECAEQLYLKGAVRFCPFCGTGLE